MTSIPGDLDDRLGRLARPYVTAWVSLKDTGWNGTVRFLVSTGDKQTTLAPLDAKKIGVDFGDKHLHRGERTLDSDGVPVDVFVAPALLAFPCSGSTFRFLSVPYVRVTKPSWKGYRDFPESRLGVDVLNQLGWCLTCKADVRLGLTCTECPIQPSCATNLFNK